MRGMSIETTPLKPIYLEMGAAVQDSQRLELYISFIVTLLSDLGRNFSDDEFKWSMDNLSSNTLGRLIEEIKRNVGFNDAAVDGLHKALKSRNFLIHRFYNSRAQLLLSQTGREKVLREIRQKRHAINAANAMLEPVMNDLIALKGIDFEQVRDEIEKKFET